MSLTIKRLLAQFDALFHGPCICPRLAEEAPVLRLAAQNFAEDEIHDVAERFAEEAEAVGDALARHYEAKLSPRGLRKFDRNRTVRAVKLA